MEWGVTLWKTWDLHMYILFSLFLQIVLIFSGGRRKYINKRLLSIILWFAYLLADAVATVALGILVNNGENNISPNKAKYPENNNLLAFWAPFLLLHLGGPDTITAFSLEDNELWLRHLLNLGVEVALALYVFFIATFSRRLLGPGLPMFIAGLLKYGERTWALFSASMDRLRSSMITEPDAGPNYAKLMEEFAWKKEAGLPAEIIVEKEPEAIQRSLDTEEVLLNDHEIISKAYEFMQTFKRLIVELILSFHERNVSQAFFLKRNAEQAFRLIETELAFIYEILYTKSAVIHTKVGCVFRLITVSSVLISLILFIFTKKNNVYGPVEVVITYILLIGGLVLEIYGAGRLIFSEWAYIQLDGYCRLRKMILATIFKFRPPSKPRWSNKMKQYNLIDFCLSDLNHTCWKTFLENVSLKGYWDQFWQITSTVVTPGLKELLYKEVKTKSIGAENSRLYRRFGAYRGEWALQRKGYLKEFGWTIECEFDQSILLWHIATDLCYHTEDTGDSIKDHPEIKSDREMSKQMSDYMLYLLIAQPFMLTAGIGQIRYGDTCAEAKNFFQSGADKLDITMARKACNNLLSVETKVPPVQVKGDRSQSVLFDGCILAKDLEKHMQARKWQMISTVWVEILCYAAGHCKGLYHAKQLSAGGELLTLVWLLTAHLGIGEQFRIEEGHARAKLIVGK